MVDHFSVDQSVSWVKFPTLLGGAWMHTSKSYCGGSISLSQFISMCLLAGVMAKDRVSGMRFLGYGEQILTRFVSNP